MALPGLKAMLAFRRVAELGSFQAAARQLGTTGSHLSKQVARLETDLGARLFHRTTRSLALTEQGRDFLPRCQALLDQAAEAADAVRDLSGAPTGRLTVAAPTSFALSWLSPRLPWFLDRHPGITLDLAIDDRFVDVVAEGVDCALRITAALPSSRLVARPLGTVRRLMVAHARYLAAAPPLDVPADLAHHACLVYSGGDAPGEWPLAGLPGGRPLQVAASFRANSSLVLRDALMAGHGVALVPAFAVAGLIAADGLVEVLPAHRPAPLTLHGITPARAFQPARVRALFDFVAAEWAAGMAGGAGRDCA